MIGNLIRSISDSPSLGQYAGIMWTDHRVPVNAIVCELKLCELCVRPFIRKPQPTELFIIDDYDADGDTRGSQLDKLRCWGKRRLFRDKGQRYCARCRATAEAPDQSSIREVLIPEMKKLHRRTHLVNYDKPVEKETIDARFAKLDPRKQPIYRRKLLASGHYRTMLAVTH